jgi:hypothetical protein
MSTSSKITFVSGVVIPALVIVATVALFFVFGGQEKTALFWFNLCYTVALEAVFFGYLGIVRASSDKLTGAFYSIMGVWALYYVIAGVAVILLYSVALSLFVPMKFYVAVVVVLTLLWLIVAGWVAETDSRHAEETAQLHSRGKTLSYYAAQMAQLEKEYMELRRMLEIPSTMQSYDCELTPLTVKMKSLLPGAFNLDTTQAKLDKIIDQCTLLLNSFRNHPSLDPKSVPDKVKRFAERSIDEIEIIKTLTKK